MFGRRDTEVLRELRDLRVEFHEHRDEFRAERDAHRQAMAEMTLQLRRWGEEHRAELRATREEFREEMRAEREALFAILDRLPPPGASAA